MTAIPSTMRTVEIAEPDTPTRSTIRVRNSVTPPSTEIELTCCNRRCCTRPVSRRNSSTIRVPTIDRSSSRWILVPVLKYPRCAMLRLIVSRVQRFDRLGLTWSVAVGEPA
jgi:hypothetical protein